MGYMRHHAIVITGQEEETGIQQALIMSRSLELIVTPISTPTTNGYRSFCVLPDGSKEGWKESDKMDERRDALIEWLYGQPRLDWVEVSFADEAGPPQILRNSSEGRG